MRAIIVAAGRGRRMGEVGEERPKCLLELAGRSLLDHQLSALRAQGIEDIALVVGYKCDLLAGHGLPRRYNPGYLGNNILLSLMSARDLMQGPLVIAYADILYHPAVLGALLAERPRSALVIDRDWRRRFAGRDPALLEANEKAVVEGGRVLEVGKQVNAARAAGEFIGLMSLSTEDTSRLLEAFDSVLEQGLDRPFGAMPSLRQAYLTDLLNWMIPRGLILHPVMIDGRWWEFDDADDYALAQQQDWVKGLR